MADEMKKSNEQQQQQKYKDGDDPERKRQNQNENDQPIVAVEVKTITTINYDCLERIFDFLDLESLLNAAGTCKRLQIAAAAKFGDDFSSKNVLLYRRHNIIPMIYVRDQKTIMVYGLETCLPFLRCFGSKISNLITHYTFKGKWDYVDSYINQYCADTLISISIHFKSNFRNEAFKKPFKNVRKVEMIACDFKGDVLSNLVDWFPNMHQLDLLRPKILKTASMDVVFPNLEHLHLFMTENDADNLRNERAINVLHANCLQLQSLEIESDFELTLSTLLNALNGNSIISKLVVRVDMTDVNTNELNRFVDEDPLMVEVMLKGYRLTAEDAINFIRQMKSMEQVGFQVENRIEYDHILNQLDNEWQSNVTTDDGEFYIKLNR